MADRLREKKLTKNMPAIPLFYSICSWMVKVSMKTSKRDWKRVNYNCKTWSTSSYNSTFSFDFRPSGAISATLIHPLGTTSATPFWSGKTTSHPPAVILKFRHPVYICSNWINWYISIRFLVSAFKFQIQMPIRFRNYRRRMFFLVLVNRIDHTYKP